MDLSSLPWQVAAFALAAWAVIGNDSLQTLGPFLQANRGRSPLVLQALFLCAILSGVLLLGWWSHGGDASWGRLASYPARSAYGWPDLLPPVAVLLLTRWGAPVSTSFLVLTAFTPANLPLLLRRSLLGYGLALLVGLLAYGASALWRHHGPMASAPAPEAPADSRQAVPLSIAAALLLQWLATGWLWSQWLIQDLANLFVVLPRRLDPGALSLSLLVLCLAVCLLLGRGGGAIQEILRRKGGLDTPTATTALSLLYGALLAVFALWGHEPLSTTWVFLGLLAGRELARRLTADPPPLAAIALDLGRDLALASLGLAVSLAVALVVQPLRSLS